MDAVGLARHRAKLLPYAETTEKLRLMLIERDDDAACFGCGALAPKGEAFLGTSRFSRKPAIPLCPACCTAEAFQGDAFGVKRFMVKWFPEVAL